MGRFTVLSSFLLLWFTTVPYTLILDYSGKPFLSITKNLLCPHTDEIVSFSNVLLPSVSGCTRSMDYGNVEIEESEEKKKEGDDEQRYVKEFV